MTAEAGWEAASFAKASAHAPTPEQDAIVQASRSGKDLVVNAGAGTGKTSTLKLLASANPERSFLYIAYNRAIADEARASFPGNAYCATAHSLAYRVTGRDYDHRLRGPRVPSWIVADRLGIKAPIEVPLVPAGTAVLRPTKLASLVMGGVRQFCYSGDDTIGAAHVPYVVGLDREGHRALALALAPALKAAWTDLSSVTGSLPFSHDVYLKLWALARPKLDYDVVLLDEAQDANPALARLVEEQGAQKVLVGDQAQAIYGWRGAIDAMETFKGERLVLSRSFRFGPAIADEANLWLGKLRAPLRLTGHTIESEIVPSIVGGRSTVLCRTNAETVVQLMRALERGIKPAIVGGGEAIKSLARAAISLMAGTGTEHPELLAFKTWDEVRAFSETDEGGDLRAFVGLIDAWGAQAVLTSLERAVSEDEAGVVISTAHKAKGREWDAVQIADDFPKRSEHKAEWMLAYVAVTRARWRLARGSLAWIRRGRR